MRGTTCVPATRGVTSQSNSFAPAMRLAVESISTRSSPGVSDAHESSTFGRGRSFTLPTALTRTVSTTASPTRVVGDSVRALMRSVPTAPAKSAGRPAAGGSTATKRTLSERSSKLSSREKNDDESGSEYVEHRGRNGDAPGKERKERAPIAQRLEAPTSVRRAARDVDVVREHRRHLGGKERRVAPQSVARRLVEQHVDRVVHLLPDDERVERRAAVRVVEPRRHEDDGRRIDRIAHVDDDRRGRARAAPPSVATNGGSATRPTGEIAMSAVPSVIALGRPAPSGSTRESTRQRSSWMPCPARRLERRRGTRPARELRP